MLSPTRRVVNLFFAICITIVLIGVLSTIASKRQTNELNTKLKAFDLRRIRKKQLEHDVYASVRNYSIKHCFETEFEGRTCFVFVSEESSEDSSIVFIGCAMLSAVHWPLIRINRRKLINFQLKRIKVGDPRIDTNWVFQCDSIEDLAPIIYSLKPRLLEERRKQKSFRLHYYPIADERWIFIQNWAVFIDRWVYKDTKRIGSIMQELHDHITQAELNVELQEQ